MKFIKSPNFTKGRKRDISTIVIHYTSGCTLDGAVSWFKNPKAKVSAHYVIGRDGTIIQMVNNEDTAWHAGRSEWNGVKWVNQFSIGIELVNWGVLKKRGNSFSAWPGNYSRVYNERKLGKPILINKKWWAPFSGKQIDKCTDLCAELRDRYDLDAANIVGHSDISPTRKVDPGPLFNIEQLRKESEPFDLNLLYTNLEISEKELIKKYGSSRGEDKE
jgi:N-acetylmuramoyl-L-alanine amidase